uniref:Fascin n=1 Tax=Macrostomum lignano TaxID=282301 RepID=A0A1I8I1J3_9PLAT
MEDSGWKVGLCSAATGKFLTAEPFGFKLNVSASSLKKRQTWTLVPDAHTESFVALRSHLNRYLSADKDGNVTACAESVDTEERFAVEYSSEGGARLALRSVLHGWYFSGEGDQVRCFARSPVWWKCQLALHPQVHLKNLNRGRYLRLGDGEISGDRVNPWGAESLITLMQSADGRVAIRASDGSYLSRTGELSAEMSEEVLLSPEFHCGAAPGLAFKDSNGRYLTNTGSSGTTKTKNQNVTKDELFVLEASYPQVAVKAFNGRYASVKQGQDLNVNQSEIEATETYQLEFVSSTGKWRFRTKDDKFWRLSAVANGVNASGDAGDATTQFELEHLAKGFVAIKSSNGYYLSAKKLGAVNAVGAEVRAEETFQLVLLNRPIAVFRCDFGFVGVRNGRLECNLSSYDAFQLEAADSGFYHIKGEPPGCGTSGVGNSGPEGYWIIQGDFSISFKGAAPEEFIFQFHSRSRVAILAHNGCYVRGEQNGTVRADATEITEACLWEY